MECTGMWWISYSPSYFISVSYIYSTRRDQAEGRSDRHSFRHHLTQQVSDSWQITGAINNGVNCKHFSASKTQLFSSRGEKKQFNSDIILISNFNVVHNYHCLSKLKPAARGKIKKIKNKLKLWFWTQGQRNR